MQPPSGMWSAACLQRSATPTYFTSNWSRQCSRPVSHSAPKASRAADMITVSIAPRWATVCEIAAVTESPSARSSATA